MNSDDNYKLVYLKDQLEKASGDQSLYSKRLFEYNIANESGDAALKELAIRWYTENSEKEEEEKREHDMEQGVHQNDKDHKMAKIGFWIGILFLIGLCIKIFL